MHMSRASIIKKVCLYTAQYPVHFSHAAIAQRVFTHIYTTGYSQVLIYTAKWTQAS